MSRSYVPDDILYLVHTSNTDPATHASLSVSDGLHGQFPGVFFSLITTTNRLSEELFPGKYCMIFSKDLLQQKNYHINIRDYNGIITEANTYFPWSLRKAVHRINASADHMNEVVFHDPVPLTFLCSVLTDAINEDLPPTSCTTDQDPDLTKLPFYAYPFEHMYTGRDPLAPSSMAFFRKMARLAQISPIPTSKMAIVRAVQRKVPFLWTNRDQQNVSVLHDHRRSTRRRSRRSVLTV